MEARVEMGSMVRQLGAGYGGLTRDMQGLCQYDLLSRDRH